MKPFKQYLIEKITAPMDMDIFKKVESFVKDNIEDYKNELWSEEEKAEGIGGTFYINFAGTPFEKIGKRVLHVNIIPNANNEYRYRDNILQLSLEDLLEDYPALTMLNHELVHYLQDISERYSIPWGTTTPKLRKKYKDTTSHTVDPDEYYPNLVEYFDTIRGIMNRFKNLGMTREGIVNYLKDPNNSSYDRITSLKVVKRRLAKTFMREPELGKRYIKKLYTSL